MPDKKVQFNFFSNRIWGNFRSNGLNNPCSPVVF